MTSPLNWPAQLITFITNIDLVSLLLGCFLSAFVAIWLDFLIKQPKLRRSGSGGGSNLDGTKRNSLTFSNEVGWFGIHIPETRIFGVRIHPSLRWGISFEKNIARDCRAHLILPETGEHIGQLWWQGPDGSVMETATIRSGDSASLIVFSRLDDKSCQYFVYQPLDRTIGSTLIPDPLVRFSGTREFLLRITHSYNKVFEVRLKIEQTHNRLLYLKTDNGSSFF